ncbi:carbohydrate kinase family protein [Hymenobacter rigui]|uniref:Carbohydrate kinase n=1 Tax=Hymenobacter rigui TaxID=334424 RepID=A0A3R9P0D0_9BACT|nr:hypothetical protein [Hymenobacter rigui]RSK47467.1 hypothetical protein EI291_14495 [Hymenobacter rigui]
MSKQLENIKQPVCIGTGLVALDIVLNGNPITPPAYYAGGSCGNVLTILSFLGWNTFPIARLSTSTATDILLEDIRIFKVNDELISTTKDGSTPIIIHRILTDKSGRPKHKFEFKNPYNGGYLPSYKPFLANAVESVVTKRETCDVFYFDRYNRASINLAKFYKSKGALVFFEPSSAKDIKLFKESVELADIIKFSQDRIPEFESLYPQPVSCIEIKTLGEGGLLFRTRENSDWILSEALSIDHVVDTAGAGDWCSAGLLFYLHKMNMSAKHQFSIDIIKKALKFGQTLSAYNCVFKGARGAMYHFDINSLINSAQMDAVKDTNKIQLPQLDKNISFKNNIDYNLEKVLS